MISENKKIWMKRVEENEYDNYNDNEELIEMLNKDSIKVQERRNGEVYKKKMEEKECDLKSLEENYRGW
jgi:hypothetical protein